MFGGRWRGLHYFESFLTDPTFWRAFRNTILLSALNLVVGFPIPIVFALLLEEVRSLRFKRAVQTISYLPRFVSLVVVIGLTKEFLSPNNGPVAALFTYLGWEPVHFLAEPGWFRPIYIGTEIWQWTGWQAIIYIAALANVNVELYESAALDGAGRFKQALHVKALPQMMPAIVIILVLRIGHILAVGFEKVLLLDNPLVRESSEIIPDLRVPHGHPGRPLQLLDGGRILRRRGRAADGDHGELVRQAFLRDVALVRQEAR